LVEGQGKIERVTEKRVSLPDPETGSDKIFRGLALRAGETIPPLSLTAVASSSPAKLSAVLEPGRRTLINFWATWCAPCAVEMPELAALYESLSRTGVDLIGISLDFGREEQVHSYLKERSIPYPNFVLGEQDVEKVFSSGQLTIPLSLVLDEEGRVVEVYSGWSADTRDRIETLLSSQ
jgi:thiol-disulfide isomerase/thioredoxin